VLSTRRKSYGYRVPTCTHYSSNKFRSKITKIYDNS